MSKGLLECPFCGKSDKVTIYTESMVHDDEILWTRYGVKCKRCCFALPACFKKEDAIRRWNNRPTEQYLKKCSDIYKATVFNLKREIKEYKSKILINGCHTLDELGLYKILEKLLTTINFTWDEKGERGINDDSDR
jgi:Lar family restriction alleviation protein